MFMTANLRILPTAEIRTSGKIANKFAFTLYLIVFLHHKFITISGDRVSTTVRNIAVFASGSGSNAENLIRYFNTMDTINSPRIALVVTNRPDAMVISRAEKAGVPVRILTRTQINDEATMMALMEEFAIDAIVLAGFLLMVPQFLLRMYPDRIINIHPSLLPRHGGRGMYGRHVHQAVIDSHDTITGITIHYVNEEYDSGQILFQASVPVTDTDTADTVEAKIHTLEHEHFPQVIHQLWGI